MDFTEISDPKGLCKDVTGLGRWGNGDVEVRISSPTELPYVVGLVRQALEKQLGSEGAREPPGSKFGTLAAHADALQPRTG